MLSRYMVVMLLASLGFFFSGCGGSDVIKPKPKPIPSWVYAPAPQETQNYIYGIGIESDRDSAIKSALSNMIAKLGVSIEQTFESYQVVDGSYSKLTTTNQIKSEVSKIKINNYKIINSYKVGYREFAVMVETDKKKLSTGLKTTLEEKIMSIEQRYDALMGRDAITRYRVKKELYDESQEMLMMIMMVAQLDRKFSKKKYLDFVTLKRSQFLQEQKSLKFFVRGDAKSLKFVDVIRDALAKNDFRLSSSSRDAVEVVLSSSDYLSNTSSMKIIVINLNISIFDKREQLGAKVVILKERYSTYESSYKNASIHLRQDIDASGIASMIGVKLY